MTLPDSPRNISTTRRDSVKEDFMAIKLCVEKNIESRTPELATSPKNSKSPKSFKHNKIPVGSFFGNSSSLSPRALGIEAEAEAEDEVHVKSRVDADVTTIETESNGNGNSSREPCVKKVLDFVPILKLSSDLRRPLSRPMPVLSSRLTTPPMTSRKLPTMNPPKQQLSLPETTEATISISLSQLHPQPRSRSSSVSREHEGIIGSGEGGSMVLSQQQQQSQIQHTTSRSSTRSFVATVSKKKVKTIERHGTQLDKLTKLKSMGTFDKDSEHEFLADLYKFRGAFAVSIDKRKNSIYPGMIPEVDASKPRRLSLLHEIRNILGSKNDSVGFKKPSDKKQEREVCSDPTAWLVFYPQQLSMWEMFVSLLVIIQVISLPYQLSFDIVSSPFVAGLERVVDVIFVIDLLFQFNLAFKVELDGDDSSAFGTTAQAKADSYDNGGFSFLALAAARQSSNTGGAVIVLVETRRWQIAMKYFKSWFFIDALAIIPFCIEIIFEIINGGEVAGASAFSLARALRIPRLLRLFKVARIFRNLKDNGKVKRFLLYSRYTSIFRLCTMFLIILLVNHFLACMWWSIGGANIIKHREMDDTSSYYVLALTDSVFLMMGERLELYSNEEKLFVFFTVIFMSIFVAIIFGEVAMIVSSFNDNTSRYRAKMTSLYDAMDTMQLPITLQERVLQFYDVVWQKHKSLNGRSAMFGFIKELSPNLAKEMHMFVYKEMLINVSFFREFTADVIHRLVLSLTSLIFMPKDYIIKRGECGTECFFIEEGKVEIFMNYQHVKTLIKNNYFGEIALITDVRRTANVQASSFVQIVSLSREDFELCMEDMTRESRKRVLTLILKAYNSQSILQMCSEPDYVYENANLDSADLEAATVGSDRGQDVESVGSLNGSGVVLGDEGGDDDDDMFDEALEMQMASQTALEVINNDGQIGNGNGDRNGNGGTNGGNEREKDERIDQMEGSISELHLKIDEILASLKRS